jgi:Phage tail protein
MPELSYMMWGDQFDFDDDLTTYTNWTFSGDYVQGTDAAMGNYVQLKVADSAVQTSDALMRLASPVLDHPVTVDFIAVTNKDSTVSSPYYLRVGADGANVTDINLPQTDNTYRYFRVVIKKAGGAWGMIEVYQDGVLINRSSTNVSFAADYLAFQAVRKPAGDTHIGDYIRIFHVKIQSGKDYGNPDYHAMQKPVYFDGRDGYNLALNRKDAFVPDFLHIESESPNIPGSIYQRTKINPRNLELGLYVFGLNQSDVLDKVRKLTSLIANRSGRITAYYTDGTSRFLKCRLVGIDGAETPETIGSGTVYKCVLQFRAQDPFWYDTVSKSYDVPLSGDTNVINNGDVEAWPIIYLTPTLTNPELRNKSTNQSFAINYTIASGEANGSDGFVIDTTPGVKSVERREGADGKVYNGYGKLDPNKHTLFPLRTGINELNLDSTSGTDTGIARVFFREKYWGV